MLFYPELLTLLGGEIPFVQRSVSLLRQSTKQGAAAKHLWDFVL